MAKSNGTIKRVTRKRPSATAPKTARKPRLSEDAAAELTGARVEGIAPPAEPAGGAATPPHPAVTAGFEPAPAARPEEEMVSALAEPEPVPVVDVEVLEVVPPAAPDAPEIKVVAAPPPPRAVSVWPAPAEASRVEPVRAERRFRRVAFVRAMLVRLRREAERRSAPLVRRVTARFPRLVALRESLRRWL